MTDSTRSYDAKRLADLHAVAVATDKHTGQETSRATVEASLSAHHALDVACEMFRRNYFPRAGRVVAAFGEVFTVSPAGRSIKLVWAEPGR